MAIFCLFVFVALAVLELTQICLPAGIRGVHHSSWLRSDVLHHTDEEKRNDTVMAAVQK